VTNERGGSSACCANHMVMRHTPDRSIIMHKVSAQELHLLLTVSPELALHLQGQLVRPHTRTVGALELQQGSRCRRQHTRGQHLMSCYNATHGSKTAL
jgi:hypothetical protein